ncbi:MAG: arginase family protein [Rhodoluna sp.]|nr:arginase family protein [Rhodoluna sp.]
MNKEDTLWPRASAWLSQATQEPCDLGVFGVPAHLTSISPTGANQTPQAIRSALTRYSLNSSAGDLGTLTAFDFGDVSEPDSPEGEERTTTLTKRVLNQAKLAIALGGDNSITYAVARATLEQGGGLITFDAHHDIREGISNGSPIRRLIEAGLPGNKIVQIGITDFSNSPEYTKRAKDYGIHVITRSDIEKLTAESVLAQAFEVIGSGPIHVDFDVDVCDRAFVPACPASAPGGISAYQLREFTRLSTSNSQVRSIDITEIDATKDSEDQRTIRLGALLILEAAAGLLAR